MKHSCSGHLRCYTALNCVAKPKEAEGGQEENLLYFLLLLYFRHDSKLKHIVNTLLTSVKFDPAYGLQYCRCHMKLWKVRVSHFNGLFHGQ